MFLGVSPFIHYYCHTHTLIELYNYSPENQA